MGLLIGWSHAAEEPEQLWAPFGCGTALEDAEWGASRGRRDVDRCQQKAVRLWTRGRPDPAAIGQKAREWSARGYRVQVLNEPNLNELGKPADVEEWPGTAEEHAAWLGQVLDAAGPDHNIYLTPFSPGVGPDSLHRWLAAAAQVAERCRGLMAHAYGDEGQLWAALGPVLELARQLGRPVWVSECGARADQSPVAWGTQLLPPFLDRVAREAPEVEAVCVFAPSWPRPDGVFTDPLHLVGTAVEQALRAWRPPEPAPMPVPVPVPAPTPEPVPGRPGPSPAANPWRGKILTVWNLPAKPTDLIHWGQVLGLDGFELKTADGDSCWLESARRRLTADYVGQLKAAGFRVMGWSYNYCDGRVNAGDRGDGVPLREADAAARAVETLGLDGHTFDLEIECEGHPDHVCALLDRARQLLPVPIGAHIWAYRRFHEGYPFEAIAERVDVLRPMIYEDEWNAPESWRQLGDLYAGRVVCPVWGITDAGATAERLRADQRVADEHGCPGVAFWEYTGLPGLAGVVELIQGIRYDQPARPEPAPPDALGGLRDRTWALAEEWGQLGWPWMERLLKGAIALSKGER